MTNPKKKIPLKQYDELICTLKNRFESNMHRHKELNWEEVLVKLEAEPKKLKVLDEMERTGGEPDVIGYDDLNNKFIFCDCSKESPKGRRSVCYDREALESRKKHKPQSNEVDLATAMGIELLTEHQYRTLQQLEEFDLKTSSWIATPADVRERGGALFCDRRYGKVFVYHNGADSYYSARGFRGSVSV